MSDTWDQRKFDEALKEYVKVSSRTLQVIINTKAYYIARKALWFTIRSDQWQVSQKLGGIVTVQRTTKKGKLRNHRVLQLVGSDYEDAPLAALILNSRRGKAGEKGFYGKKMERAIRGFITARKRSLGFMKSGWLPSIQILAPLADKKNQPEINRDVRQVGRAKGTAKPATMGFQLRAEIVNLASPIRDKKGALIKYGGEGLDIAFQDETASMWEYIEDHMKPDADKFNAAQK
jgi:hypothetical protein